MGRIGFTIWLLIVGGLGYGVRLMSDPEGEGAIAQQSLPVGLALLTVVLAIVLLARIGRARVNPLWWLFALAWELALVPVAQALMAEADPLPLLEPFPMRMAVGLLATLAAFLIVFPGFTRAFAQKAHVRALRIVAGLAALGATLFMVPLVVAGALTAFPFARIPPAAVDATRAWEAVGLATLNRIVPGDVSALQLGLVAAYAVAGILILADRLGSRLPTTEEL